MNSVCLLGRLTKDPEIRRTQNDLCVATFTLAIDRISKEKQTDFPRVTCFGKTAELVEKYVKKGNQLGVTGRIQTGSYDDKNGNKVYTTDVVADRVNLIWGEKKEEAKGFERIDDEEGIPF